MVMMPVGGMAGGLNMMFMEVPAVIRQAHAKYWWMLLVLQLVTVAVELIASDVFGVLFCGAIAFCIWYMVRGSCQNMTQYCLFMFGLMCFIEALFEIITLGTVIGGRSSATTTRSIRRDGTHTVSYTTVVNVTPFFDWGQGLTYNAESFGYLLSPATMVIGAILSCCSYYAYPVGMWGTDLEGGGDGDFDGSFDRRFRDEQLQASGFRGVAGAHGERERRPPVFEGYARRLGD